MPEEPAPVTLEECVAAFEAAVAQQGWAPLKEFVPSPAHPEYALVVRELARVEMELAWAKGRPRAVNDYRREFPEVFRDPQALGEIAFEEYRQRREHGQDPSRREYRRRYGIDTGDWPVSGESALVEGVASDPVPLDQTQCAEPDFAVERAARAYEEFSRQRNVDAAEDADPFAGSLHVSDDAAELFREAHRSDPARARDLAGAVTGLPEVGGDFLEFHLLDELGRGAFGRVYLAEQRGLANRPVALKVSTQLFNESQTLAQLQHTNIVPIYSVHEHGTLQAVCMPYFGSTTLADVARDMAARPSLPVSGHHLVSTLQQRKSTVRSASPPTSVRPAAADGAPAPPATEPPPPGKPAEKRTTDALSKLTRFGYVEAVLWIGGRLADALAHAHERGICHQDLKPANVLLTDEGQPMLLDFNLSDDRNLRRGAAAARIGGTLPYMAPEQLAAFQDSKHRPDPRSDLYSLGLILYELLTGRHPYPAPPGPLHLALPRVIELRRKSVGRMRPRNARVSPAVESILRRSLEHDPDRRYQTAGQLREDIDRHLAHLPLRHAPEPSLAERVAKFHRRHPLLTSSASLLALTVVVVLGLCGALYAAQQRYARLDALDIRSRSADDIHQAKFLLYKLEPDRNQVEEGVARCRKFLETYPVVDIEALGRNQVRPNPAWDQLPAVRYLASADERKQLGDDLGEVLLMYVRAVTLEAEQERDPARRAARAEFGLQLAELAEQHLEKSRAAGLQRARLARVLGKEAEARELTKQAEVVPLRTARDHYLAGMDRLDRRDFKAARALFQEATRLNPQNFWTWFYLGLCHAEDLQHDEAAYCFTACLALAPRSAEAFYPYVNRGLVYLRSAKYRAARDDLGEAVRVRPDAHGAVVQRAIAAKELGEAALRQKRGDEAKKYLAESEESLTRALALKPNGTWVYFLRAAVRAKLGDAPGAKLDRQEGLRIEPDDAPSWIDRGYARLASPGKGAAEGALADFEKALELNPRSAAALQNKAHVLAERLGRPAEAVAVLNKAIDLYSGYVPALLGRGVLLARTGKREEAIADARRALELSNQPLTFYQTSNIYALTSKQQPEDRFQAFPLLSLALRGGFGLDVVDQDSDMDPIRQEPEFRRLVQAARQLSRKASRDR
jgi:serine/threonine protein kinase/Tfp pilus assembly protein PilF